MSVRTCPTKELQLSHTGGNVGAQRDLDFQCFGLKKKKVTRFGEFLLLSLTVSM